MAGLSEEEQMSEEDMKWSQEYTLSELVDRYDMPCLVRVSDGIYSTEDTESFSNGDLLKLHSCERLEKIVAYPVGAGHTKKSALKNYKEMSVPILIPLDYRKKARILTAEGDTRYPTVQSLLADIPRYVEVGSKPIYGRHLHTREIVMVPARSPLELLRTTKNLTTKSVSLLCRYDKHELELEPECRGNFVAVRDPTSYTFREIVNRFCLPQLIELKKDFVQDEKFVTKEVNVALANMDQFQGHFILDRVEAEYQAFGTHRLDLETAGRLKGPDSLESEQEGEESNSSPRSSAAEAYTSHQAVVIIPFTSDALFQVATNRETSAYESFISLNFRAELDTVCLGGLYMEMQGSKLSKTVESDYWYPDLGTLDIPDFYDSSVHSPPLLTPRRLPPGTPYSTRPPPRPSRPPKKNHSEQYSTPGKSSGIDVLPISPPSIPPRTPQSGRLSNYRQPLPRSPGAKGIDVLPVSPPSIPPRTLQSGRPSNYRLPLPRPPGVKVKVSSAGKVSTLGKVSPKGDVSPRGKTSPVGVALKSVQKIDKPSQAVRPLATGTAPSGIPLATIDRKGRKPTYLHLVADQATAHKSKVSSGTDACFLATGKPPTYEELDSKEMPVAGASGYSQPVPWSERLKTLSVEEVSEALEMLGLRKKVQPFVQMEIDGGYLLALFREQSDILQAEPFSLNTVEILKLKMYVDTGKVPIKK